MKRSELMPLGYRCFENPAEHGSNQVSMAHDDRIAGARGSREELLDDLFESLLSQPALGERNNATGSTRWQDFAQDWQNFHRYSWEPESDYFCRFLRSQQVAAVDLGDVTPTKPRSGASRLTSADGRQHSITAAVLTWSELAMTNKVQ
jgi:hypothetical protein